MTVIYTNPEKTSIRQRLDGHTIAQHKVDGICITKGEEDITIRCVDRKKPMGQQYRFYFLQLEREIQYQLGMYLIWSSLEGAISEHQLAQLNLELIHLFNKS